MPSLITHSLVALGATRALAGERADRSVYVAAAVLACLPDADVVAFRFGIPYDHALGHRGFSHSLGFALVTSLVTTIVLWRRRPVERARVSAFPLWMLLFAMAASHGLLDAFTNGGHGIAFAWPFTAERFFAPWRPIQVSPIGIGQFLGPRGVRVIVSEARWVWAPLLAWVVAAEVTRRRTRADLARAVAAPHASLDCGVEEGPLDGRASEAE